MAPRHLRGYISSRPFQGERVPQHIQNLTLRDYCRRAGAVYLLSATEYAMPDTFLMLEQILNEVLAGEGIVAYSLFQLPPDEGRRRDIYSRILERSGSLHFALEGLSLVADSGISRLEDLWLVRAFMDRQG